MCCVIWTEDQNQGWPYLGRTQRGGNLNGLNHSNKDSCNIEKIFTVEKVYSDVLN